jgi:hypothetical protein
MTNAHFSTIKHSMHTVFLNKLGLAVLLLTLLWVVIDAKQRFFAEPKTAQSLQPPTSVSTLVLPKTNEPLVQALTNTLAPYQDKNSENSNSNTNQRMTLEQQAQQSGDLSQLFVGDKTLTLKALITKTIDSANTSAQTQQQKALLLVTHTPTNESVIESFENKANVYGYQLSILSNNQIMLTKENAQSTQQVTLTLYETQPALPQ